MTDTHAPEVAASTAPTPPAEGTDATFTKAEVEKLLAERLARETRQREKAIAEGVQARLEQELAHNVWLDADPDLDIIFDADHKTKWKRALAKIGVSPEQLASTGGTA